MSNLKLLVEMGGMGNLDPRDYVVQYDYDSSDTFTGKYKVVRTLYDSEDRRGILEILEFVMTRKGIQTMLIQDCLLVGWIQSIFDFRLLLDTNTLITRFLYWSEDPEREDYSDICDMEHGRIDERPVMDKLERELSVGVTRVFDVFEGIDTVKTVLKFESSKSA